MIELLTRFVIAVERIAATLESKPLAQMVATVNADTAEPEVKKAVKAKPKKEEPVAKEEPAVKEEEPAIDADKIREQIVEVDENIQDSDNDARIDKIDALFAKYKAKKVKDIPVDSLVEFLEAAKEI